MTYDGIKTGDSTIQADSIAAETTADALYRAIEQMYSEMLPRLDRYDQIHIIIEVDTGQSAAFRSSHWPASHLSRSPS